MNAGYGAIDHAGKFVAEIISTVCPEPALGFFGRKPGGIAVRLLRSVESRYRAQISVSRYFNARSGAIILAADVTDERRLLDSAVDPSLFERLQSRCLSVGQPRLRAAFGKDPASAASLHQEKFYCPTAYPVTDRRDLLASPQLSQLRQTKKPGGFVGPVS